MYFVCVGTTVYMGFELWSVYGFVFSENIWACDMEKMQNQRSLCKFEKLRNMTLFCCRDTDNAAFTQIKRNLDNWI
jgi:hypothetical protein